MPAAHTSACSEGSTAKRLPVSMGKQQLMGSCVMATLISWACTLPAAFAAGKPLIAATQVPLCPPGLPLYTLPCGSRAHIE